MADDVIRFPPDSTASGAKQVVFDRTEIPGITGDVFFQYVRLAQPPTYIISSNLGVASGRNHIAIYNKTNVRLRVEHIYAHPTVVNNSGGHIPLQCFVTTTEPTDGNLVTIRNFASDFVNNPASGNNVVARENSTVAVISGYIVGGGVVDTMNNVQPKLTATIFKKDVDHSSLQLLSGQGIVIKQIAGSSGGSIATYTILTLDTS